MRYGVQDFHPEAVVEPLLHVGVLHPVVQTIERCAGLTLLIQCRHHQHPTLVLSQKKMQQGCDCAMTACLSFKGYGANECPRDVMSKQERMSLSFLFFWFWFL